MVLKRGSLKTPLAPPPLISSRGRLGFEVVPQAGSIRPATGAANFDEARACGNPRVRMIGDDRGIELEVVELSENKLCDRAAF